MVGAALGWTAGLYAIATVPGPFNSNIIWIVAGGCLGVVQWLVLRPHLRNAWQWIAASLVGWLVAFNIGSLVFGIMTDVLNGPGLSLFESAASVNATISGLAVLFIVWLAIGAAGGAVAGGVQWFVLRQYFPRAAWWVAANAVGWGVGIGASWFAVLAALTFIVQPASNVAAGITVGTPLALVGGALSGAITGYALIRILRQ
jgi:hypothetical protein